MVTDVEPALLKISGDGKADQFEALTDEQIESTVAEVLASTACIDVHTHLYPSEFGRLGLWGIDELLTYHYLEAEFFRSSQVTPEQYWRFSKQEQADAIWRTLFVENSPISEATRGIVAVLQALGLPTGNPDLTEVRQFFRGRDLAAHTLDVLQLAGVSTVVMTNDPLDHEEASLWMNGAHPGATFQAVLRLDRLLREWSEPWERMNHQGYDVGPEGSERSIHEIRRFLAD